MILWDALDFTRRMCVGILKQVRALTRTYYCDDCQCYPLSYCAWFVCSSVNKRFKGKGSNWFCGRCGHMYNWREGSQILWLRCGPETNDAALYRAPSRCQREKWEPSSPQTSVTAISLSRNRKVAAAAVPRLRMACADVDGRSLEKARRHGRASAAALHRAKCAPAGSCA